KEPLRRRWGKAVIVTAALFIPDTFRPEVSYLSHYLGFLTGVVMAAGLFRLRRKEFRSAEEREYLLIEDGIGEEEWSAPLENSP
ncbi:MAG: hypothetical protein ACXVB9_17550, partial [Bdellovibrionota bacterium]